ncbi:hypothetical protein [Streptomyces sp. NPDC059649]|uniref:hypothetical protein n=1 Tax=Streptomyces sp. NPDC059649 TaxID=3346895 RepID=UPI003677F13A
MPQRGFEGEPASSTFLLEIAQFKSVRDLVERARAEGQVAGDDLRRAFEADQIPVAQWKNLLRRLNEFFEQENVTLLVSAAPARMAKRVSERDPVARPANKAAVKGRHHGIPAELSDLIANEGAPAAAATLFTGMERIFRELGPPPEELLGEYRSEAPGGGGGQR